MFWKMKTERDRKQTGGCPGLGVVLTTNELKGILGMMKIFLNWIVMMIAQLYCVIKNH